MFRWDPKIVKITSFESIILKLFFYPSYCGDQCVEMIGCQQHILPIKQLSSLIREKKTLKTLWHTSQEELKTFKPNVSPLTILKVKNVKKLFYTSNLHRTRKGNS